MLFSNCCTGPDPDKQYKESWWRVQDYGTIQWQKTEASFRYGIFCYPCWVRKEDAPLPPLQKPLTILTEKKVLVVFLLDLILQYLIMLGFNSSCLRPARWFLTCHCIYFSGRFTRSTPSHAISFSAQCLSKPCSSTNRNSLFRGIVASDMSNNAM